MLEYMLSIIIILIHWSLESKGDTSDENHHIHILIYSANIEYLRPNFVPVSKDINGE